MRGRCVRVPPTGLRGLSWRPRSFKRVPRFTKPPQIRPETPHAHSWMCFRSQERLHSRPWVHRPKSPETANGRAFSGQCVFSEWQITISSDQAIGGRPRNTEKSILVEFPAGFARIVGSVELGRGRLFASDAPDGNVGLRIARRGPANRPRLPEHRQLTDVCQRIGDSPQTVAPRDI